jgi:hypothetical protein
MPWSKQIKDDRTSQNNTNSGHIPWKCIILFITFLPTLIGTTSLYWNIVYSLTTFMQRIDWLVNGQWKVPSFDLLLMITPLVSSTFSTEKCFAILRMSYCLFLLKQYSIPTVMFVVQEIVIYSIIMAIYIGYKYEYITWLTSQRSYICYGLWVCKY